MIISENTIGLSFPEHYLLSDEEFFQFCQANKNLRFERIRNEKFIIMRPTGGETGRKNSRILIEIGNWNLQNNYGEIFVSSTGFTLPDQSVFSPDVALIAHHRWNRLSPEEKKRFPPICPEFIVKLKSENDSLQHLNEKMQLWLGQGIRLGWLIDSGKEKVYIYQPGQEVIILEGFDQQLRGEPVLAGFALDLMVLR